MDFHVMKRKQLQALCKNHGFPANSTNREMADRLASMFQETEELVSSEKLNISPEDIGDEATVVKKQVKKVRFSPENETFEYEVSVYRRPGRRSRKRTSSKKPAQVIVNALDSEDIRKTVDCQVRVTRSRVQNAVEDDVNMVFSPPVGRKKGRGGMKNKDAELNNNGKSEVSEMGDKNDNGKVTGRAPRWQLRSSKNVTQEDSKKIGKRKGVDEVHLLDESFEEGVVHEDEISKNGSKKPTRKARKEVQSATLSGAVEKSEVVSRVRRQTRAQLKDVASMVISEVKNVDVQGEREEALQLKKPHKGRRENAVRKNAVPLAERVRAEIRLVLEDSEAEKPLRRSKRNIEKDCVTAVQTENQVTKVQDQSEGDITKKPLECLMRNSSRRKSVVPQSGNEAHEGKHRIMETRKRFRTSDLEAIMEHTGGVESPKCVFTSQDQPPLRRSRRKTVIVNDPAHTDIELVNKEDTGKIDQGKEENGESPRKSVRNANRYNSSGTSKEEDTTVARKDCKVKQQRKEPLLEEEKTYVIEHHPVYEKLQRRSNRISSRNTSTALPNSTAKVVKENRRGKSRMVIIEDKATVSESHSPLLELSAGKDKLLIAEGALNKTELDLKISKQVIKNSPGFSNQKGKELMGKTGEKEQCGYAEAPLFLDLEEFKDSARSTEEASVATSVKQVGISTDQGMQHQSAHKFMVVYEKESNLAEDDRENLALVANEVNCMPYQSDDTKCLLDDANCSNPAVQKLGSNVSHLVDSFEITYLASSSGPEISDEELNEDVKSLDVHSGLKPSVVHMEDRNPVESEKKSLVQVDTADREMNHHELSWSISGRGTFEDPNLVESRQAELGSNGITVVSSEITFLANGLSVGDKTDLTGQTNTLQNPEIQLQTELTGGENTSLATDNANADDSRTSYGENQIKKLKFTNVTAAESLTEATFNFKDHLNEFGNSSGSKTGSENSLKRFEGVIALDFSNREGISDAETFAKATENLESNAEFPFLVVENGGQMSTEIQQSTYRNIDESEIPIGPAQENQAKEKTGGIFEDVVETAESGVSDQATIGDINAGIAHCFHDSVFAHQEITASVKNDKELSFREDTFEGEMNYHSCLSLNGMSAIGDSTNLAEPRKVDLESSDSKLVFTEITSPAFGFTSASQAAGKTSSYIEDPLTAEILKDNIVSEGCRTLEEDSIMQLEDAKVTAAESVEEVIFNDLLKELGESFGLKKMSEIPAKTGKLSTSEFSDGEGIALTRTSAKATKKQEEERVETDIVTQITGTPNILEIKGCSNNGTTICRTPFGLAAQGLAGITVNIAQRKIETQDEETSLVKDDKISVLDNILEGENKYDPCLSWSKKGTLNEGLGEPRKVEFETNASKAVYSEIHSLANDCLSASKANLAGETSNGLELEKILKSEESLRGENVNYKNDKTELENEKDVALDDQNPNHLENDGTNAAGAVQEFVVRNHLSKPFENCSLKQSEVSLNLAEQMSDSDSSEKGTIQTENSVQINEKGGASGKIHNESSVEITDEALKFLNIESDAAKQGSDLPSNDLTTSISSEPFSIKLQDHVLMDRGMNRSGHKVMETFKSYFAATICSNESGSIETNVGLDDNMMDKKSISGMNVELDVDGDNKVVSDLHDTDINLLETIFQESEVFTVASTEAPEEMPNALMGAKQQFQKANCVDVDDKKVASQDDCSIGLGPRDVGKTPVSHQRYLLCDKEDLVSSIMDSDSRLKNSDPQSGTIVEDADANGGGSTGILDFIPANTSDAANELDIAFVVEEAGDKDGGKTPISHQRSLHCEKEDLVSSILDNDSKLKSRDPQSRTKVEDPDANEYGSTGALGFIPANASGVDAAIEFDTAFIVEEAGGKDGGKTPIYDRSYLNGDKKEDVLPVEDKNSRVSTLESTGRGKDPQPGTMVEDPDVNDIDPQEAGPEDNVKALVSHQRFLHGHKQEDVPTDTNKRDSESEISIAAATVLCSISPLSLSAMDESDGCQIDTGCLSYVIDGSSGEKHKDNAEAKSDDCEGSEKSATLMDGNDISMVNRPSFLDEIRNSHLDTEESDGLRLHDSVAGDSREVESCNKNIASSVKPEMFIRSSSISSICATSEDMNLLWWIEDEVKEPEAKDCESSHAALDKFNPDFCSTVLKDCDYIASSDLEDIKFSEERDDFKDIGETMELRKALDEATADKSPPLKDSELGQVEPQEAFRSDLDLMFSQKKNKTAKRMDGSKSVCVKQLTSSIMKSKKCNLIQRTPKRLIIPDMKENEPSTKKVGSRTTPRTWLKRRPLENVWKP